MYESGVVEYGLRRAIISAAVIAATLLEIVDITIVNVSLPNIQGNFGVGIDLSAWVVTGYIIANVVVIPITPWLAARFGRRQYFFASIVIFTIASLMCGLSGSLGQLILWRVVQGLGGGALIATSQAILRDTYPLREQGTAQGIFAMGVIVGPALGPVLGGWITDNWNWHWVFFINLPVGIAAASLIWSFLRNPHEPEYKPLDVIGLALMTIGLAAMQYVLEQGQQYDWFDDMNIRLFTGISVVSLVAFVFWTLRSPNPVVDLRILKMRQVASGSILGAVLGISLYGSIIILPQYLQNSLGFTATLSGTVLLFRAAGVILCTPITAFLAQRGIVDVRISAFVGFVLLGISNWMLANVTTPGSQFGTFIAALFVSGVGLSQIFVPLSIAVLGGVPADDVPATSAFFNVSRQIGGSLATAVLVTMLVRGFTIHQSALADMQSLGHTPTSQFLQTRGGQYSRPALTRLEGLVISQAAVQSYADAARSVAIVTLLMAPMVLLLSKPRLDIVGGE